MISENTGSGPLPNEISPELSLKEIIGPQKDIFQTSGIFCEGFSFSTLPNSFSAIIQK
jgi:hypothetical protein